MDALKYDLKQVIFICKRQVLLLFVCIIIEGCMTYAQPLLLTKITDQGILGKNLTALLSSVLFFVAAKVSVAGCQCSEREIRDTISCGNSGGRL